MIFELALTGLKSRFKDYLVLFSGLMAASMIFYMFLSLATNPSFLAHDISLSYQYTSFIFIFGLILLSLITFVYVTYANNFLLSMRQRDYAMFMMLGTRGGKIALLIFLETMTVGLLSSLVGVTLGIGLTQLVAGWIETSLGLSLHHFAAFYLPAILWTFVFFTSLFFLAGLWNSHKLVRTPIIHLLHEQQTPVHLRQHTIWRFVEAVLGLVFLGLGYWAMAAFQKLMLASIPIALITIVAGSFFIFDSLVVLVLDFLRHHHHLLYHGIRAFTLGQLKFRLHDYTKFLATISILFALALGAITVGLNFNTLKSQFMSSCYYDAVVINSTPTTEKKLASIPLKQKAVYRYKVVGHHLYVNEADLAQKPPLAREFYVKDGMQAYHTKTIAYQKAVNPQTAAYADLAALFPGEQQEIKLASGAKFKQLKAQTQTVTYLLAKDFSKSYGTFYQLTVKQMKQFPQHTDFLAQSKPVIYRTGLGIVSGFEFMGLFLGLAFLMMLASTLMFKVLSGAASDKIRYQMLHKMGTQNQLLRRSIRHEIGSLFALPAILGMIHVLFGLQFFKTLLPNPYHQIWLPFLVFAALYGLYYLVTVKLYDKIVLG